MNSILTKSRPQLIKEIEKLQERVKQLEHKESERTKVEKTLVESEEKKHKHLNELLTLYESSLAFSQLISPEAVGKIIVNTLEKLMNWQRGSIWTINETGESLNLFAHSSMGMNPRELKGELERVRGLVHRLGEGISGWVALHGKPVRIGNVGLDPRYISANPAVKSEMCVPLKIANRTIGSINVESTKPNAFTEFDERLLSTLANQAATAIENSRLYEALQKELTERKQTEEALRESEVKNKAILEAIPDLMFILSREGEHLDFYANDLKRLFVQPENFIGKQVEDVLPDVVAKKYHHHISQVLDSGEIQIFNNLASLCRNASSACLRSVMSRTIASTLFCPLTTIRVS